MVQTVRALDLPNYTPEANDLFSTWNPSAGPLVFNSGSPFVGDGYDWTGVYWNSVWGPGNIGKAALVSPLHGVSAEHVSAVFLNTQMADADGNRSYFSSAYSTTTQVYADLSVGAFAVHVSPAAGNAIYAVPDFVSYVGRDVLMIGHGGQDTGNSLRVAASVVTGGNASSSSITTSRDGPGAVWLRGGDSGSPLFLTSTDPRGNNQLLLLGTASGVSPNPALNTGTNYHNNVGRSASIDAMNNIMATNGFALKLVGESATSWTGTDSADFGTAGNWSSGAPVASNYVTFDSAVSATQTVDLGGTDKEMRGVVFNPGAAGEGITFQNGTLLVGRGGVTNYSAETQTFSTDIRLTSHQIWDAAYGNHAIAGNVDLNGKLLVAQGDHDTVIEGVVSGSGPGLSKYGLGSLTLKSAATYSGTTWLYGGTLTLEENGALPTNTTLIVGNNNTSLLEMNGKTLTLARMVTNESITGGQATVDLGAAGKINLYKSVNSGQDVFAAKITGGTAGTVALEIGGWQSSASISNSFWLTGASDYVGQTILKGQIGGEGSGNGLVMRITNPQALGAWGAGNETTIQFTDISKPIIRLMGGGTWHEDFVMEAATTGTSALGFETPGETMIFDGDIVISRAIQTAGNQRVDLTVYGTTTANFGDIRGQLAQSAAAATGSAATTLWMWANDAGSVVNLNGEISDGTIKGAGTRGLAMDFRGAGTIAINHANSYTGATSVRSTVTANVNALSGQNGAFGNATTAVTIGGVNTAYGQAILAGNGVEIGRNITVSASHSGALALGAGDNAAALFSGSVALNRQADLTAGANSTVTFSGSITHAGGTSAITKTGAGTVILSGSNSHTGGTTVSEGTLRVQNDNALATTGTVSVNAGTLLIDAGVTVANPNLTVSGGTVLNHGVVNALTLETGVVGGRGLFNVAVDFNDAAADILAPGASPGITSFGVSQDWGGLNYQWEVQDFAEGGLAGTDFDAVAITGGLNLSGSAYELEIFSLDTLGNQGAVANYAPEDRQWTILTASSGITGFDAADWTINASAFEAYQPGAQFSLHQDGNSLVLSFSPIPEPGTLGLILLTSARLLFLPRRARRAANPLT